MEDIKDALTENELNKKLTKLRDGSWLINRIAKSLNFNTAKEIIDNWPLPTRYQLLEKMGIEEDKNFKGIYHSPFNLEHEITVDTILKSAIKNAGGDGLCGEECGCSIDDLVPCGGVSNLDCVIAKKTIATENGLCYSKGDMIFVPLNAPDQKEAEIVYGSEGGKL